MVLVQVHASLVSPGTELGGWQMFSERYKANTEGAREKLTLRPFGYSSTGIVLDIGKNVKHLTPGDRVACIGAGYALHTDYAVVPQNLCISLPNNVTFNQGAYAMLLATAL